jgi:predicted Zn-dependent protease
VSEKDFHTKYGLGADLPVVEPLQGCSKTNLDPQAIVYNCSVVMSQGSYTPDQRFAAIWWRALAYEKLADYPNALKDTEADLAVDPKDPKVQELHARLHIEAGQYAAAIADTQAALALRPAFPAMQYLRGIARLKSGDTGGKADINAASAHDPKLAAFYAGHGLTP